MEYARSMAKPFGTNAADRSVLQKFAGRATSMIVQPHWLTTACVARAPVIRREHSSQSRGKAYKSY